MKKSIDFNGLMDLLRERKEEDSARVGDEHLLQRKSMS